MARAAVFLLLCCIVLTNAVKLPSHMIGVWDGTLLQSVLGPVATNFVFTIQNTGADSFLFSDDFSDMPIITGSTQKFYGQENDLLYCGLLDNYFSSTVVAPIQVPLSYNSAFSNSTHLVWCSTIGGCDFLQWDFWSHSANSLEMKVMLSGPVVHVHATFVRSSRPLPVIPSDFKDMQCNFSSSALPAGHPPVPRFGAGGCPYSQKVKQPPVVMEPPPIVANDYQYCFQLNAELDYQLKWNFDLAQKTLDVEISAPTAAGDWIAIGFQPDFPGMNGSDVVMGYTASSGAQCVRPMYAQYYVGPPLDSTDLELSATSVSYANGRSVVSFSRPFVTGHNPIPVASQPFPQAMPFRIIWAIGAGPMTDCTGYPNYHGPKRGVAAISWNDPFSIFDKTRVCPQ